MLKLRELRGVLTEEERARWDDIKAGFQRVQAMGGGEDDPVTRVTGSLGLVADQLRSIGLTLDSAASDRPEHPAETTGPPATFGLPDDVAERLDRLQRALTALAEKAATPAVASPAAPQEPALPPAVMDRLAGLALGLDNIGAAIDRAAKARPAAAPSGSPSQVQVVQVLPGGVQELLDDLTATIGDDLMDAVRDLNRWIDQSKVKRDARVVDVLDRTLKGLDQLKDLVGSLRNLDTRHLMGRPQNDTSK